MIDTVIFDLFGTLVHLQRNTRPYLQLCRCLGDVRQIRQSLTVDASTLFGFCEHCNFEPPQQTVELQRELEVDVADCALFDDSLETLENLSQLGIRIGLVSNLASPYKAVFYNLGLDKLIDDPIFSCDVGFAKPAVEIYRLALQGLDATPESTLMVGDSQRCDVDGPMACGIRGVLIDRCLKLSNHSALATLTDISSRLN